MLAAEDEADAITREVVLAVRRTFVTPFDRGSIQTLISRMDDAIDQMKKAAKTVMLFEVTAFDTDFQRMGDAILRCAHLLREAVPLLVSMSPNAGRINELCEQIRRVEGDDMRPVERGQPAAGDVTAGVRPDQPEGDADDIHETCMIDLFRRCQPDGVLRFIAAREILDQLERIVDRFDDAANEIEGIVVEHV